MSDLYTLFATNEDRDRSRAAAERYQLLQAVREQSAAAPRSSLRNPSRYARARAALSRASAR